MMTLAWANVRSYARRYIAVVLAVMIGTAFLAATLMVGSSATASLQQSIGTGYKHADLIASVDYDAYTGEVPDAPYDPELLAEVEGLDAVRDVQPDLSAGARLGSGDSTFQARLHSVPAAADFRSTELAEGEFPDAAHELTVDTATAERAGIDVGDTVSLAIPTGEQEPAPVAYRVSGLTVVSANPAMGAFTEVVVTPESLQEALAGAIGATSFQLKLADGADAGAAAEEVSGVLRAAGVEHPQVLTAAEQTVQDVASLSGGSDQLTVVLLVFALVALVVTGLVVTNTFSVLVTQRTRELALLRTLGAARGQIRGAVVLESVIIGVVASALGVLLAVGVMSGLIGYVATLPGTAFAVLSVPVSSVLIGLGVGTAMTILAAWIPARQATRVAPLAALRPADGASVRNRAGRARLVLGGLGVLLGAALLAFGAFNANLLVSFAGGFVSFIGILMIGSLFLPPAVSAVGRLVSGTGVPAKLAALNSVRNPGRTTATATALLIGVTLVSMILVGAQSAKATFDQGLAAEYPVDVTVQHDGVAAPFGADAADRLTAVDGVEHAVRLVPVADSEYGTVYAADPEALGAVLNDPSLVPARGEILLPDTAFDETVVKETSVDGDSLTVRPTDVDAFVPLVTADTAAGWDAEATVAGQPSPADLPAILWADASDSLDVAGAQELQSTIAAALGVEDYSVGGGLIERQMFTTVIDMLLMVVTGLLAVAVLIALIGVANTLSLSILERTRENSLLRALGLTTRQLRGMLALEAVLIAGVAALIGLGLGTAYGLLGTQSALGFLTEVVVDLPWIQLAAVLAVAVCAGLLASVVPARRAARLSPVAGLATE
ncbi:ABC transporter permease [Zhihengliuella alba]